MHPSTANGPSHHSFWLRVREYAVPFSMIDSATARRAVGDWAGACAAARVDVDLDLRSVTRTHGRELAARVRADLRHLAPDLLRWHLPRIAPDGLLRPGLTVSLARYRPVDPAPSYSLQLVARTPPAWANAGQRISLALWDGTRSGAGPGSHPHPRPDRRFRLDLHRHLWDARRSGELRERSGSNRPPASSDTRPELDVLRGQSCAVDRWAAEAELLLRTDDMIGSAVAVRLAGRSRLVLTVAETEGIRLMPGAAGRVTSLPLLPDASTWVPPDLALLRAGLIEADRLHPLVASALVPGQPSSENRPAPEGEAGRIVECQGARHRIGLVGGVLVALDHDADEIRREELLVALTGTPLPCLRVIDEVHRHPECLVDVRARLDHGDTVGALTTVEGLLGPDALLRSGSLRDELEAAARRRVAHGLFRAGLAGLGPDADPGRPRRPRGYRARPRHALHAN